MDTKELKIQVPEGYEIDKENSTFELIKFKPIKKYITYKDVCNKLFKNFQGYLLSGYGEIEYFSYESDKFEPNSATNRKQLDRLLALNQLLNITEYYNRKSKITNGLRYKITYIEYTQHYDIHFHNVGDDIEYGISVIFNRMEDAQAVIDNPNFKEILDIVYKDC